MRGAFCVCPLDFSRLLAFVTSVSLLVHWFVWLNSQSDWLFSPTGSATSSTQSAEKPPQELTSANGAVKTPQKLEPQTLTDSPTLAVGRLSFWSVSALSKIGHYRDNNFTNRAAGIDNQWDMNNEEAPVVKWTLRKSGPHALLSTLQYSPHLRKGENSLRSMRQLPISTIAELKREKYPHLKGVFPVK